MRSQHRWLHFLGGGKLFARSIFSYGCCSDPHIPYLNARGVGWSMNWGADARVVHALDFKR